MRRSLCLGITCGRRLGRFWRGGGRRRRGRFRQLGGRLAAAPSAAARLQRITGGFGLDTINGDVLVFSWAALAGIAGVVLEYRLPQGNYHRPLLDAQRAIRLVRVWAKEWKINPHGIGIMGFSAGGELAAFAAMKSDGGKADAEDMIERTSAESAPWVLVPANDKYFARITILKTLCERIEAAL